jgi:Peptidase_C39 like family
VANFYKDSHGESWGVMMQEKTMSCGPASVAMTEVYYKSSVVADLESRIRKLSQRYPGKFTEESGTNVKNLVSVLRDEGVKCYDALGAQPAAVWSYLYAYANDNTPVIVHIAFSSGGHFAVCPYVYKKDQRCIFLDPWYGLVELAGSSLPDYTVGDPTGTFPPVKKGNLSGWIIVTKR